MNATVRGRACSLRAAVFTAVLATARIFGNYARFRRFCPEAENRIVFQVLQVVLFFETFYILSKNFEPVADSLIRFQFQTFLQSCFFARGFSFLTEFSAPAELRNKKKEPFPEFEKKFFFIFVNFCKTFILQKLFLSTLRTEVSKCLFP